MLRLYLFLKVKDKVVLVHAVKVYEGAEVHIHSFVSGKACPVHFASGPGWAPETVWAT
jgi:hypothetical protein